MDGLVTASSIIVGVGVAAVVRKTIGFLVGETVVGDNVEFAVGPAVGSAVGPAVGAIVGASVGASVDASVGAFVPLGHPWVFPLGPASRRVITGTIHRNIQ